MMTLMRVVRQGDLISLKLFIAKLVRISKFNCENQSVNWLEMNRIIFGL